MPTVGSTIPSAGILNCVRGEKVTEFKHDCIYPVPVLTVDMTSCFKSLPP